VLTVGLVFFIFTLASWFGTAIRENLAGMNSGQLHQSYVLGMFWFIFSEVMFFAAFFGALLYVRQFAGPWLAGEGEGGRMNGLLWPGFEFAWPPVTTPQEMVGGAGSQVIANNGAFVSQETSMAPADAHAWYAWLPMWNTMILLSSSATVHVAHTAILAGNRKKFNRWLGITVGLAVIFLGLQAAEYYEAYVLFGLTLNSGIYGSTFFHADGLPWFPCGNGYDHVADPAGPLSEERALHRDRPLWLRSLQLVLAFCRCGVGVLIPVCLHLVTDAGHPGALRRPFSLGT
jgi:cytochrome c oxidase subunit 3